MGKAERIPLSRLPYLTSKDIDLPKQNSQTFMEKELVELEEVMIGEPALPLGCRAKLGGVIFESGENRLNGTNMGEFAPREV